MSSSKIIRNSSALDCQNVMMANLDEVVESQGGSFVVMDCASLSTVAEQEEVDHPAVATTSKEKKTPKSEKVLNDEALRAEYERGRQSGIAEVEAQLSKASQSLATACSEINSLKEQMLQRSSDDMLRLVLAIAERVVQGELTINPEVIARTVQQAIQVAVSAEEFRIKVNPDDLEMVQERKPLFVASLSGLSHIEFLADPTVTRGGCVLESALGRVDATLEAQLEAITITLQQAIGVD